MTKDGILVGTWDGLVDLTKDGILDGISDGSLDRTSDGICGMLNVHPYRLDQIKEKPISEIFEELRVLDLDKKKRYP